MTANEHAMQWLRATASFDHDAKTLLGLIAALEERCRLLEDDQKIIDSMCLLCANPDIETPWRHEHEVEGRGVIGHWHHCIDPGDELPSPCKNSDRLEEVFQETHAQLDAKDETIRQLRTALEHAKVFIKYARYELQPGLATLGDQFPRQEDADKVLKEAEDALSQPSKGNNP